MAGVILPNKGTAFHPLIAYYAWRMKAGPNVRALAARLVIEEWAHETIYPSMRDLGCSNDGKERRRGKASRSFQCLPFTDQAYLKVAGAQKLLQAKEELPATGPFKVKLVTSSGPVSAQGIPRGIWNGAAKLNPPFQVSSISLLPQ